MSDPPRGVARDPVILALFALAPLGLLLPAPPASPALPALAAWALAEEAAFRWGLQDLLSRRLGSWRLPLVTPANAAASALFAALHLLTHPPAWALATLAPSLAFGLAWDRRRSLVVCWLLHLVYNLAYFRPF